MDSNLPDAPLFNALDETSALALRDSMNSQSLKKGDVLFQESDLGDQLYLITEGKIKLSHTSSDGRESLFTVLGPGDMFGELSVFDPGPRTSTAIAVTDVQVLGLKHDVLRPWLTERPEVAQSLLQALANRLRRNSETMSDLVFADVPGRVAKVLLQLNEKFGVDSATGRAVPHDLTQEEIAQLVGASRETVNKALADFVSRGWIRLETRSVHILELGRLQGRAK
ncbi:MAG: Crp/Fnr family transcriptional regulator [Actinobacteria bacterium]|nr:Crp/Fnr family transcriptional regulator [Actinomycetota bacterium]NBY15336.1 Crp/Fnr family transcriptional regulator [Actinomycetota bacterium]